MLLQLKKTSQETIQRILTNISLCLPLVKSKPLETKICQINNDILKLKDDIMLIMSIFHYYQTKSYNKQKYLKQIDQRYRQKQQEQTNLLKNLRGKNQKLNKQLQFIKFSNQNLRKQLATISKHKQKNLNIKIVMKDIQTQLKNGTKNVCQKIQKIVKDSIESQQIFQQDNFKDIQLLPFNLQCNSQAKQVNFHNYIGTSTTARKKWKSKDNNSSHGKEKDLSKTKKKSQQLAKIVQQQGKLTQIKQRYLSTDLI